jgi:metallo-beta-lactamase class B
MMPVPEKSKRRRKGFSDRMRSTGKLLRSVSRRRWRMVLLVPAAVAAVVLFGRWREATRNGGQQPAEPFRIAGNLYYVGANDVSVFLLTGPEGHVLIDGGYPGTAPMVMASIARLGFDIRDVKVLLNSEPHFDHAGGLAALQQASGAALWASGASAGALASGGDDPDVALPLRALIWTGLIRYAAARVDHRIQDGDTVRVGPVALTAHLTGGHTRGCTSWSFPVHDEGRVLNVVSACSLIVLQGSRYPEQAADLERSFRVLRGLSADVWVSSHARLWGRYRKFTARDTAASPVAPFIDPQGYRAYVDTAEARFRRGAVQ